MIFAITQLVHEFWPQKKKSEGKDDENWQVFWDLRHCWKTKKGSGFRSIFFLKVRCSAKTKRERRRREKYGRQLRMTCFGVWLNYFDVKKIYSFPSSVQSMYINIIRGYYYGNFRITWQCLLKPWKRKKQSKSRRNLEENQFLLGGDKLLRRVGLP